MRSSRRERNIFYGLIRRSMSEDIATNDCTFSTTHIYKASIYKNIMDLYVSRLSLHLLHARCRQKKPEDKRIEENALMHNVFLEISLKNTVPGALF